MVGFLTSPCGFLEQHRVRHRRGLQHSVKLLDLSGGWHIVLLQQWHQLIDNGPRCHGHMRWRAVQLFAAPLDAAQFLLGQ
jgi:hypothetical protein